MPRPAAAPGLTGRQLAAVALVDGFEFYDFTVYGTFAVPIGRTFFPAATPWTSLLLSVAVFGIGFVARPAGAVFFGTLADRRGRKPAMLLTVTLMMLGTLGVALTPGHAVLGVAAPALMVAARLVQGFALGGEIGPSVAYLAEAARPGRLGQVGAGGADLAAEREALGEPRRRQEGRGGGAQRGVARHQRDAERAEHHQRHGQQHRGLAAAAVRQGAEEHGAGGPRHEADAEHRDGQEQRGPGRRGGEEGPADRHREGAVYGEVVEREAVDERHRGDLPTVQRRRSGSGSLDHRR